MAIEQQIPPRTKKVILSVQINKALYLWYISLQNIYKKKVLFIQSLQSISILPVTKLKATFLLNFPLRKKILMLLSWIQSLSSWTLSVISKSLTHIRTGTGIQSANVIHHVVTIYYSWQINSAIQQLSSPLLQMVMAFSLKFPNLQNVRQCGLKNAMAYFFS